ncbi:hypothetical protein BN1708_012645 [Verticillium longisporum]|uniref:Aminoglycoside phosphotransferase domain-containing protein n=1 Tax=Verticillium longisporum TaxID=100787 RepID=A0A0G4LBN3_VERLO|nr:hypothetical protein BN1708_012645 [Verticillium longisporum]
MTASIRTNVLPSQANVIFEDSSFFRRHPDVLLPTLSDVKAECAKQNSPALSEAMRPPPVILARIDGSALYDVEVNGNGDKRPWTGPFDSVKALHDWFAMTSKMGFEAIWPGWTLEETPDGFRHLFPDDSKVVFTHGDLHPTNIMVNPDSPGQIVAIIDWEQSGWWPDYWEFCKAECTVGYTSEWRAYFVEAF